MSYAQIEELSSRYKVVPVSREIYADVVTPIGLLSKISRISNRYYLLESVEGGEKWGRYSFLGFDPIVHISCRRNEITVEEEGTPRTFHCDHPYAFLRRFRSDYSGPRLASLPPFTGGLVGYFSYNMIEYTEPSLDLRPSEFDDFALMLFDKAIVYDHMRQKISVIANIRTHDLQGNYRKAMDDMDDIVSTITRYAPLPEPNAGRVLSFGCNVSEEEYKAMILETKKRIESGGIFQAVISRRFEAEYHNSLINAYRVLRTTNPSPYMVYLQDKDVQIMSTSPETLVRLKDGVLTTFPIAGSRPRGENLEEDGLLEKEMLEDEKELSEHNMLVDLARNDLAKVCKCSTVEVKNYKHVQRYSKVMHIASEVQGQIEDGKDAFDVLQAVIPAGTVSGAPKVKACQIIEEIERDPRGIYGGAIGYIDFTGNMDMSIGIRMAVRKDGKVYVQSGSGIVADSIPENECEESKKKAEAVLEAIVLGEEVGF
ncbi:MAG: anthranilate synthase component I family protein [Firmicutes bacterium]|nr:anthranilate synthase component I family protein [Candidatus Fermentithermobacillaceae bacterium]